MAVVLVPWGLFLSSGKGCCSLLFKGSHVTWVIAESWVKSCNYVIRCLGFHWFRWLVALTGLSQSKCFLDAMLALVLVVLVVTQMQHAHSVRTHWLFCSSTHGRVRRTHDLFSLFSLLLPKQPSVLQGPSVVVSPPPFLLPWRHPVFCRIQLSEQTHNTKGIYLIDLQNTGWRLGGLPAH